MHRTIPIQPYRPARPRVAPTLSGDADRIDRVLVELQADLRQALGLQEPPDAWLRELRLQGDEALLALAPGLPFCGGDLQQTAFETLRRLLPDTDIYVRTAAQ